VNFFDLQIISYVNQLSQHSWALDKIIGALSRNDLLKGGVLVTILWWAWFKKEYRHSLDREHITSTLLSCIVAIALARALALTLPFRPRPLHEQGLHFLLPYGSDLELLNGWSSFPSDHAVLFFTLSTGLLFVDRKMGVFALLYSILFISFPRIYLGLHYPTDIIAGAIIGITIALIANIYFVKNKNIQSFVNLSHSRPSFFYPLFFLFTYQIASLFEASRDLVSGVFNLINYMASYLTAVISPTSTDCHNLLDDSIF
jgi:undecaprenyl-diphosphatase